MPTTTATNADTTLRTLQGVTAIAAMICITIGSVGSVKGYARLVIQNNFSSSPASLTILTTAVNYTAAIIAAYYVVVLRVLNLVRTAPSLSTRRFVDTILALVLAVGGVAYAISDVRQDCSKHNEAFAAIRGVNLYRCNMINWGMLLTFATSALFVATLALSYKTSQSDQTAPQDADCNKYASVSTPVVEVGAKSVGNGPVTRQNQHVVRAVRLGGRALLFGCSALAFIFTVSSYEHDYASQYLSPRSTYSAIVAYTCALYALWHLAAIEYLGVARRASPWAERSIDILLLVGLVVAGAYVAASEHLANCDERNETFTKSDNITLFRCGSMRAGMVLMFVSALPCCVTLGASFVETATAPEAGDEASRETEDAVSVQA